MRAVNPRYVAGVTLVELMVTVAVLAVMLVAAAPSFSDFFERYRLRSAADDALNLFATARQAAVEADRNVGVRFVGGDVDWCGGARQAAEPAAGELVDIDDVFCDCANAPAQCQVGGDAFLVNSGGRGVSLADDVEFAYDSKGGTLVDTTTSPQLVLVSSSERYAVQVEVSALGQARACVPVDKRPIPGYSECN